MPLEEQMTQLKSEVYKHRIQNEVDLRELNNIVHDEFNKMKIEFNGVKKLI